MTPQEAQFLERGGAETISLISVTDSEYYISEIAYLTQIARRRRAERDAARRAGKNQAAQAAQPHTNLGKRFNNPEDVILPYPQSWGKGYMRITGLYGRGPVCPY